MMTSMPTTSNVLLCILSTSNYDGAFCFLWWWQDANARFHLVSLGALEFMVHLRAESCSSLVPMINTLIYILCQPSESTSSSNGSSCLLSSQVASPLDFRAKFGTKSAGLRSPPPLTKDSSFSVSTEPFCFKQVPEEIIIPSYLCLRIFSPHLEFCNLMPAGFCPLKWHLLSCATTVAFVKGHQSEEVA